MKKIFKSLFLVANLLVLSVSCKFASQQSEAVDGKVKIKISANFDENYSRKAVSDQTQLKEYYESLVYTLSVTDTAKTTTKLFENKKYTELSSYSGEFTVGKYTFTMSAFDTETKKQILSGVCDVDLSTSNQTLVFKMKPITGTKGNLNLHLYYSSGFVSEKEGVEVSPTFTISYRTVTSTGLSDSVEIKDYEVINEVCEDGENVFYHEVEIELPVEKYLISASINYTDLNGNEKTEYIGDELVYISPNQNVFANLYAVKALHFHQNDYKDENGKDKRNYLFAKPFTEVIPGYEEGLKAGDVICVNISGYFSDAIQGTFYLCAANTTMGTRWIDLGGTIFNVDVAAGGYISKTEFITIDKDCDGLEDLNLCLIYGSEYLDKDITLYNYNINIITDLNKITYYKGNYSQNVYVLPGTQVTLPDSLYDDSRRLIAWYDNPELKGTPVTEIAAEDNTGDKNFYSKYALVFQKNGSYNNYVLNLDQSEFGYDIPLANQVTKVVLTGIPSVSMEGIGFNCTYKSVNPDYEDYTTCWRRFVLEEEKTTELRFDYFIPGSFNPYDEDDSFKDGLGFTVSYDQDNYNGSIELTDWSLSVVSSEISTSAENTNFIAEAKEDGIHFTIKKTETYGKMSEICLSEEVSNVSYNLSNDFTGENKEIVFPYVTEGKGYKFELGYNQGLKDGSDNYWNCQDIYISSIGGLGDVDTSVLDNIKVSLTDNDEDPIRRYLMVTGFVDNDIKSIFDGIDEATLNVTIWGVKGSNDWGAWGMARSDYINNRDSDPSNIYAQLAKDNKFELTAFSDLSNLKDCDAYWASMVFKFGTDDDGYFSAKEIKSQKTTYIPVGPTCKVTFVNGEETYTKKISTDTDLSSENYKLNDEQYRDFVCWMDSSSEGNEVGQVTEDITVYAKWEDHAKARLWVESYEDDDEYVLPYGQSFAVTMETETDHNNTIYYELDGSTPTSASTQYSTPIAISTPLTLTAIVISDYYNTSDLYSKKFTFQLPEVTFSKESAEYISGTELTLSSIVEDAVIYYTTDGTEPTTSSTKYTNAISLISAMTVKAIATKSGYKASEAASEAYTIRELANFDVVTKEFKFSLSQSTSGDVATIAILDNSGTALVEDYADLFTIKWYLNGNEKAGENGVSLAIDKSSDMDVVSGTNTVRAEISYNGLLVSPDTTFNY